MGFHVCQYCKPGSSGMNCFPNTSSGDVNLAFANGHSWVMPDMILHYVVDHGWAPPKEFIDDVLGQELAECGRAQTRALSIGEIYRGKRVGYLEGELKKGLVPDGFAERLITLVSKAGLTGSRAQTKSVLRT